VSKNTGGVDVIYELMVVLGILTCAWGIERGVAALKRIEAELSTTRWEQRTRLRFEEDRERFPPQGR
jgi:hypothetical protein